MIVLSREESGNNDVHYMHLDLASLQSVREFAGEVCLEFMWRNLITKLDLSCVNFTKISAYFVLKKIACLPR